MDVKTDPVDLAMIRGLTPNSPRLRAYKVVRDGILLGYAETVSAATELWSRNKLQELPDIPLSYTIEVFDLDSE